MLFNELAWLRSQVCFFWIWCVKDMYMLWVVSKKKKLKTQLLKGKFCIFALISRVMASEKIHSSPHLLVTQVQLMRPGIGRNTSCAVADFANLHDSTLLPSTYRFYSSATNAAVVVTCCSGLCLFSGDILCCHHHYCWDYHSKEETVK